MLDQLKVKRYLNQKEDWTLYDEILHFYASIHMKEVFKFWGLSNIKMQVEWKENTPVMLNVYAKHKTDSLQISFDQQSSNILTGQKNSTPISLFYSDFNSINDIFDTIRDALEH